VQSIANNTAAPVAPTGPRVAPKPRGAAEEQAGLGKERGLGKDDWIEGYGSVEAGGVHQATGSAAVDALAAGADADNTGALPELECREAYEWREAYVSAALGEVWNEVWLPQARKWLPWSMVRQ
jgi:hypothetical protein